MEKMVGNMDSFSSDPFFGGGLLSADPFFGGCGGDGGGKGGGGGGIGSMMDHMMSGGGGMVNMGGMMEQMQKGMRSGNANFHSSAISMSCRPGAEGNVHVERFQQSSVGGRHGDGQMVSQTQQAYENSSSGLQKATLERTKGDRARKTVNERAGHGGRQTSRNLLRNLNEKNAGAFESEWERAASSVGLPVGRGGGGFTQVGNGGRTAHRARQQQQLQNGGGGGSGGDARQPSRGQHRGSHSSTAVPQLALRGGGGGGAGGRGRSGSGASAASSRSVASVASSCNSSRVSQTSTRPW